jgi:DNA polymerase-3 subunit delta'
VHNTNTEVPKYMCALGVHGALAHAYAIEHRSNDVACDAAIAIAQSLYCTDAHTPCGVCGDCTAIARKEHVAVVHVIPEGDSLKIEHVRAMQRAIAYRTEDGGMMVAIIHRADVLTLPAANALLKTLEEPEDDVLLLVLVEQWTALLPTLRSRMQRITPQGGTLCGADIRAQYPGVSERDAVLMAEIAPSWAHVHGWASAEWFAQLRDAVIHLMPIAMHETIGALALAQRTVCSAPLVEHITTVLDVCIVWAREQLLMSAGIVPGEGYVFAHEKKTNASALTGVIVAAHKAQKQLRVHAHAALVFEQFLISCAHKEGATSWYAS